MCSSEHISEGGSQGVCALEREEEVMVFMLIHD